MSAKRVTRCGFVSSAAVGVCAGDVVSTAGSNAHTGAESELTNKVSQKRRPAGGSVSWRQVWGTRLCQHKIDAATPRARRPAAGTS